LGPSGDLKDRDGGNKSVAPLDKYCEHTRKEVEVRLIGGKLPKGIPGGKKGTPNTSTLFEENQVEGGEVTIKKKKKKTFIKKGSSTSLFTTEW